MKKRSVLFTITALLGYVLLTSYQGGPAYVSGYDCTGAHLTSTNCSNNGSCHGGGTGPTVSIAVYSGNTAVTGYHAGQSYKIHIHGSGTSWSWFGFQAAVVKNSGYAQTTAGTLTAGYGIHTYPVGGINIIEHSQPIHSATAGSFDTSFTWAAPVTAGTGTLTIYCTINAVNDDGSADNQDVSGNTSMQLTEGTTSVNNLPDNISMNIYPNPFTTQLHLQITGAVEGNYEFNVYDMSGKIIFTQTQNITNSNFETNINTGNWAGGMYILQILKDGSPRTIQIIKQ